MTLECNAEQEVQLEENYSKEESFRLDQQFFIVTAILSIIMVLIYGCHFFVSLRLFIKQFLRRTLPSEPKGYGEALKTQLVGTYLQTFPSNNAKFSILPKLLVECMQIIPARQHNTLVFKQNQKAEAEVIFSF